METAEFSVLPQNNEVIELKTCIESFTRVQLQARPTCCFENLSGFPKPAGECPRRSIFQLSGFLVRLFLPVMAWSVFWRFGISEHTADSMQHDTPLSRSLSRISIEWSAHKDCLVHNTAGKATHLNKVHCLPRHLLIHDSFLAISALTTEVCPVSDFHNSKQPGNYSDTVIISIHHW